MSKRVFNMSAKEISDSSYWIQKRLLSKLEPRETPRRVDDNAKTPEERLLDAIYYEPKVFWTLGGNGATIRLFTTDLDDKVRLFNLSFYEDPKDNPTVKYLTEHSIDEIFAGKNPDMMPDSVCIVEGGDGIIEINFKCSEKLKVAGVDESFLLNRDLDEARIGVVVEGHGSKELLIGYTKSDKQEPYVKTYCGDRVTSHMTF